MEEAEAPRDTRSFITEQPKTHHPAACEGTALANPPQEAAALHNVCLPSLFLYSNT